VNKSESIKNLCASLIKAKANFKPMKKSAHNPYHNSKYTTLDVVIDATDKALSENDLCITQLVNGDSLNTVLMHTSGEFVSSDTTLRPVKESPQAQGSAITYARRYALSAILGVASESDDDGNGASKGDPKNKKPAPKKPAPAKTPPKQPNNGVSDFTPTQEQLEGQANLDPNNPNLYSIYSLSLEKLKNINEMKGWNTTVVDSFTNNEITANEKTNLLLMRDAKIAEKGWGK